MSGWAYVRRVVLVAALIALTCKTADFLNYI